jgi:hypothetical protein
MHTGEDVQLQLQRLQHSLFDLELLCIAAVMATGAAIAITASPKQLVWLELLCIAAVLHTGENVQLQQACLVASYRALHTSCLEGVQECGLRICLPSVRVPVPTCGQCDWLL